MSLGEFWREKKKKKKNFCVNVCGWYPKRFITSKIVDCN
jgi:hypothetical protein